MPDAQPGRYALLMSSSDYAEERLNDLASPGHDAQLLAEALENPAIGGYETGTLRNPTASEAAIALEDFFAERQHDDVMLLYYSGHGLKSDDGELYLATSDTRYRRFRSTALATAVVRGIMRDCHSRRQVVILD